MGHYFNPNVPKTGLHWVIDGANVVSYPGSGSVIYDLEGLWDARRFVEAAHLATLTALVPTQLFDLIQLIFCFKIKIHFMFLNYLRL